MRFLIGHLLALAAVGSAAAQSVTLSGRMGERALLVINGTPRTVTVGTTQQGVKLVSVGAQDAVVEIDGKRVTLALGAPVNLGGAGGEASGTRIVMSAGPGGHFVSGGQINGKQVQFLVDTGATSIALGKAEADRIGLDYKSGERGYANTANGQVLVYRTLLNTVRLGDVTVHNVEAVVGPEGMPYVLLGNSFLTRFQMKRENDILTLERR